MDNSTTVYELAGGAEVFSAIASAFYRRVISDPLMLPLFENPDEDHAGRLALWLGEYFGGPAEHTRLRGGDATMARTHVGMRITNLQRDRWLDYMRAACEEVNMSAEFLQHFEPKMFYFADLAQRDSWSIG